jgi:hypothetical protein
VKAAASNADQAGSPAGRGHPSRLARWAWTSVLIAAIAGIYAVNVAERLDQIRSHNLRTLEQTAQAVEQLVANAKTTLISLANRPKYACEFFERQTRLTLDKPDCKDLGQIKSDDIRLKLHPVTAKLQWLGSFTASDNAATNGAEAEDTRFVLEIEFDQVLRDAPFGGSFDAVLVADDQGRVVEQLRTRRVSPFESPGEDSVQPLFGLRIENLQKLRLAAESPQVTEKFAAVEGTTTEATVRIAGTSFSLMCQPLRIELDQEGDAVATDRQEQDADPNDRRSGDVGGWRLCGLVGGERSFRESLELASPLVISMFAIALLGLLGWPIFKVLTVARRERLRFVDVYLVLLATAAVLMVITTLVANLDSAGALREVSRERLKTLAEEIDRSLGLEFAKMFEQLEFYDGELASGALEPVVDAWLPSARQKADPKTWPTTPEATQLLRPVDTRSDEPTATRREELRLESPTIYPYLTSVFWMRPCDGQQVIKATVWSLNTPGVSLGEREYFRAVRNRQIDAEHFYVQSFASITTGEFSTALSSESQLAHWSRDDLKLIGDDCTSAINPAPAAAISTRPLSVLDPVLAPGVGFAIVDADGKALFHSDVRRATLEGLLDDDGISRRLRAALQSRASVHFDANYRARSHQIYVAAMADRPWSIVTFADDEILRTSNLEVLARTAVLATLYLLLLTLATLVYLAQYRRDTPRWIWPLAHWEAEDRVAFYRNVAWTMTPVLLLFVVAVRSLSGDALLLVCILAPVGTLIALTAGFSVVMSNRIGLDAVRRAPLAAGAGAVIAIMAWLWLDADSAPDALELAALIVLALVIAIAQRLFRTWWHYPLRYYMITAILLWSIVAILPAYGFFKIAHESEMALIASLEQDFFHRARGRRDQLFEDYYRDIELLPGDRAELLADISADCGVYDASLSGTIHDIPSESNGQVESEHGGPATSEFTAELWRFISRYQPIYNDTTSYARYRDFTAVADPSLDEGSRELRKPKTPVCNDIRRLVTFSLPLQELKPGLAVSIGGIATLGLLWAWVVFSARRLFFGELCARRRTSFRIDDAVQHRIERHTIAIVTTDFAYDRLIASDQHHRIFDLSSGSLNGSAITDIEKPVFCIRLERALTDPEQRTAALSFLEQLVDSEHGAVLVASSVDVWNPALWALVGGNQDGTQHLHGRDTLLGDSNETARWRQLIAKFDVRHLSLLGTANAGSHDRKRDAWKTPDAAWLQAEIDAIDGLRQALGPGTEAALDGLSTRREAIAVIASRADRFYRTLWDVISIDEKLVLIQLEDEGLINPKQMPAVRRLLNLGLLRMDPVLRLVNDSLGAFASGAEPSETVRQWESVTGAGWTNKRAVLLGIIFVILLFLWFTQRNLVETWIAYLGAAAMGISGVFKIMGSLRKGGEQVG